MYRLPSGLAMAVLSDAGSFGWEDRFTSCHCEVGAVKKRFEGAGLYGLLPKTSIESFYLIQKIKGHHIKLTGLPVKYDVAFFLKGKDLQTAVEAEVKRALVGGGVKASR